VEEVVMTAEEWNFRYPPGTEVLYYPLRGREDYVMTRTRSEAWELGDGTPVVLVEGKTGGISLEHLRIEGHVPGGVW
jgi:hypothetical protein